MRWIHTNKRLFSYEEFQEIREFQDGGGGGGGGVTLRLFLDIWEFENLKFLEFGEIYPAIAGRKISVFENLDLLEFLEFVKKRPASKNIKK